MKQLLPFDLHDVVVHLYVDIYLCYVICDTLSGRLRQEIRMTQKTQNVGKFAVRNLRMFVQRFQI